MAQTLTAQGERDYIRFAKALAKKIDSHTRLIGRHDVTDEQYQAARRESDEAAAPSEAHCPERGQSSHCCRRFAVLGLPVVYQLSENVIMKTPRLPTIKDLSELVRWVKPQICDDYIDEGDTLPSICLTVGADMTTGRLGLPDRRQLVHRRCVRLSRLGRCDRLPP